MSNLTNDRDILNECQFTINIAINNKLGHLGPKLITTTTLIMTIIKFY